MTPPRTSVLIPAFNEEEQLPRAIACIRESFQAIGESSYEIVVCDNNSSDATSQVAQRLGVRVVFEPHNQISRARNAAASRALGEWLIFIDADTYLHADLLAATLKAFRQGGIVGGGSVLRFDKEKLSPMHRALVSYWNFISVKMKLAAGSYLFCLRQAWEEVGGFDQAHYAGEEIFFSRKIKAWGRKKGLRFTVITGAPIVTSARKLEWYGQWQMLKHIGRMFRPGFHTRRENCGMWYERPAK
jgi:glycosyltransferase involved in cell wall biosynthesis